jgi:hypothetical protein
MNGIVRPQDILKHAPIIVHIEPSSVLRRRRCHHQRHRGPDGNVCTRESPHAIEENSTVRKAMRDPAIRTVIANGRDAYCQAFDVVNRPEDDFRDSPIYRCENERKRNRIVRKYDEEIEVASGAAVARAAKTPAATSARQASSTQECTARRELP